MEGILSKIIKDSQQGKKSLALLLDPDEYQNESLKNLFSVDFKHVSYLFVGGSLLKKESLDELIENLKSINSKPVILFPGNSGHISDQADAILFLSLISGRNPDYLIGQQVISAPIIKEAKIEVLPTAYMLIDGGKPTTVQYMSNTMPIPADKPDIAACTALAGQYLGLKITYLDAGSGAENPIPSNINKKCKKWREINSNTKDKMTRIIPKPSVMDNTKLLMAWSRVNMKPKLILEPSSE